MVKLVARYLEVVRTGRLEAPALKRMVLTVRRKHKSNNVAREIVRKFFLPLRFANPHADVLLDDVFVDGPASVSYETVDGRTYSFDLKSGSADEAAVMAQLLIAFRSEAQIAADTAAGQQQAC